MNVVTMYRDPEGMLLPRCSRFEIMMATRDAGARNPRPRESLFERAQWHRHLRWWLIRSDEFLPECEALVSDCYRQTLLPKTLIALHENDPWEFVR